EGTRIEIRQILVGGANHEHATRTKDAPDLGCELLGARQVVNSLEVDHHVEALIREAERLRIHLPDFEPRAVVFASERQNPLIDVDPDHSPSAPRQITQALTGTAGNLENFLALAESASEVIALAHSGQLSSTASRSGELGDLRVVRDRFCWAH